jgi:hypothetical protein
MTNADVETDDGFSETGSSPIQTGSWTHADLRTLYELNQSGLTMRGAARLLNRSPAACERALNKVIAQQLVWHPMDEVADHYNDDDIAYRVTEAKYYVPLDPALAMMPKPAFSFPYMLVVIVTVIGFIMYATFPELPENQEFFDTYDAL